MAAARRRAWRGEGQAAGSLAGGLQLEPQHWQGAWRRGGEENPKKAGPPEQTLTLCPRGEAVRDGAYLGNTDHRSDTSEMSCCLSAPTLLPTLGFPPELLQASG